MGETISDLQKRMKQAASLDGEEQWTCTPGSRAEVPKNDLLFDRLEDPFQLKNIRDKDPKRALELSETLREFLAELRTC